MFPQDGSEDNEVPFLLQEIALLKIVSLKRPAPPPSLRLLDNARQKNTTPIKCIASNLFSIRLL